MSEKPTTTEEPFLVKIIRWSVYFSLLIPLVISGRFFFPYVGPKGLFFMAIAQVVFFSWLYLAINYEQYRPKLNAVLVSSTLFIAVLGISAAFGTDPSRSFWSKFERMSGVLFHLHLLAYLFAVSSTFKFKRDWNRFFGFSLVVGMVVSVIFFLSKFGVNMGIWAAKKGSTLGNSSFMGTYLLFNVYLALILFIRVLKKPLSIESLKNSVGFNYLLAIAGFVINGAALLMSSADAARLTCLGGLVLLGLFYLMFKRPEQKYKWAGAGALLIGATVFIIAVFHPESPFHQRLVKGLGEPRFVVWRMAWEGFKARPLLGWGSNNFIMVYSKFFDPWKQLAGGAPWFDRAHNIVFNYLATTGILGFLSYLGLYIGTFYILAKRYLKKEKFWIPAIVTAFLIAYFTHLLTVFDMPVSYMMFFLLLAFVGSYKARPAEKIEYKPPKYGTAVLIALLFVGSFWTFVVRPAQGGIGTIAAIQTIPPKKSIKQVKKDKPNQLGAILKQNSQQRLKAYENTLNISPMGKYQIRNFFAKHSRNYIRENRKDIPPEVAKQELNYIIDKLEKSRKQSPNDLKTLMNLTQGYSVYSSLEPEKVSKVAKYAKKATEIAPNHQYGYSVLAKIYSSQNDYDRAVKYARQTKNLEPIIPRYQVALVQVLQKAERQEEANRALSQALDLIGGEMKKKPDNYTFCKGVIQLVNLGRGTAQEEKAVEYLGTALDLAEKKVKDKPGNPQYYEGVVQMNQLARGTKQEEKASQLAEQALSLLMKQINRSPANFNYYKSGIQLSLQQGKRSKAQQIIQQATNTNPNWESRIKDLLSSSQPQNE